jgi:DNA-binding FadR family transcriptional regulator
MFQPVRRKNTVDIAIDNIGEYIINHLQVGDVLPAEREIAERLQISRNITREALQHYRTLGIIESKPKVGAVVARLTPAKAYDGYLPFISIMEHGMEDLLQLRLMLELGAAEAAVSRVKQEDVDYLLSLCRQIESHFQMSMDGDESARSKMFDLDLEFHSAMLRLSGNKLLESLIPLVVEFFSKSYQKEMKARVIGYREHYSMVEALQKHDLTGLQELIRSHIKAYIPN